MQLQQAMLAPPCLTGHGGLRRLSRQIPRHHPGIPKDGTWLLYAERTAATCVVLLLPGMGPVEVLLTVVHQT